MAKEVKNPKKGKNFYFYLYDRIQEGSYPSKIAKELGITKQNIKYYSSFFIDQEVIEKKEKCSWIILKNLTHKEIKKLLKNRSKKKFSLGTKISKPQKDMHALQIKIPILEGKIKDSSWEIKEHLKNWIPKYKKLGILGGLGLKNNNNKSITVWVSSRKLKNLDEVDVLAFKVKNYLFEYFLNKHNVVLDIKNCETKNINLATEDKIPKGMLVKGEKFEINLNKKAEKIFPKDNMDAKAWIDGSPYDFSAETNDKEWKRAYLSMPFNILGLSNSLPTIKEYNKNIKLHTAVQEEQLITQKENQKTQKETQEALKEIRDFLKRVWDLLN